MTTICVFFSVFVIIQAEIGFLKLPRRRKASDIVLEMILPDFLPAKIMKKNFKIAGLLLVLALAITAVIALLPRSDVPVAPPLPACETEHEAFAIRGDSLAPQFADGQEVRLFVRYYECHPLAAGDVVAYRWAGNKETPIAKVVKAVAGDSWRMALIEEAGVYQIAVNGEWLKNSAGELYQIPEQNAKMLRLYADAYPEIPEGACLILGNKIEGSTDSVKFGLASQKNIIGKIEP